MLNLFQSSLERETQQDENGLCEFPWNDAAHQNILICGRPTTGKTNLLQYGIFRARKSDSDLMIMTHKSEYKEDKNYIVSSSNLVWGDHGTGSERNIADRLITLIKRKPTDKNRHLLLVIDNAKFLYETDSSAKNYLDCIIKNSRSLRVNVWVSIQYIKHAICPSGFRYIIWMTCSDPIYLNSRGKETERLIEMYRRPFCGIVVEDNNHQYTLPLLVSSLPRFSLGLGLPQKHKSQLNGQLNGQPNGKEYFYGVLFPFIHPKELGHVIWEYVLFEYCDTCGCQRTDSFDPLNLTTNGREHIKLARFICQECEHQELRRWIRMSQYG